MASQASAIAAAELRVTRSRLELREGALRLRQRLTRPSSLAAAAVLGVLLGFLLIRGGRAGTVAAALAIALVRRGVGHLASAAGAPRGL